MRNLPPILAATRSACRACCLALASFLVAPAAMSADDSPARAAQDPTPLPRVAVVFNGNRETHAASFAAFLRGMTEAGYVNGRNVMLDVRWAEGRLERLPQLIGGVLERAPQVIVVSGSQAVHAAKSATATTPIVMAAAGDAVAQKLVASFAHPGGNVTGIAVPSEALMAKILEQLHELVPRASRIAVLTNPSNPVHPVAWKQTEAVAKTRGLSLLRFEASALGELERALSAIAAERPHALVVSADALFNAFRARIVRFSASLKIPTGHFSRDAVNEGGLLSYAPSIAENYFASTRYVQRILQGARPHQLPVAESVDFELFVNTRTAKALGITIPQSVIASAEELID